MGDPAAIALKVARGGSLGQFVELMRESALPMSPQDAITECLKARDNQWSRWPVPLIAYLDEPLSDQRVFDWLCPCVGDLLGYFGKISPDIQEALSLAQRQAAEGTDRGLIESLAWRFWSRRSLEDVTATAVAQLLFALSRCHRSQPFSFAASCSTPIVLMERFESRRGEVFERVLSHFSAHVGVLTA